MKTSTGMIGLTLLVFTCSLLLPADCLAQTKKMTAKEMATESTSILYGKCTKVKSAWTKEKDMIITTVTVVPEYYLKGNHGNEVSITIPGGQVDDIIYEVSEMPVFRQGEEVFTFLWEHPSGKKLVTGGFQGKMHIETDVSTGARTLSGRQLTTSTPRRIKDNDPAKLHKKDKVALDEFTKEVKGYLK